MVKEDMAEIEVTEEDTEEINNWRRKIRCGWEKPKEEEEEDSQISHARHLISDDQIDILRSTLNLMFVPFARHQPHIIFSIYISIPK